MDGIEHKVFNNVLTAFQEKYPNRNIQVKCEYGNQIIYVDDMPKFCITGYNLLYNLKRLCESIEDELI